MGNAERRQAALGGAVALGDRRDCVGVAAPLFHLLVHEAHHVGIAEEEAAALVTGRAALDFEHGERHVRETAEEVGEEPRRDVASRLIQIRADLRLAPVRGVHGGERLAHRADGDRSPAGLAEVRRRLALEFAHLEVLGCGLALFAQPLAERLIDGLTASVAGFLEGAGGRGARVAKEDGAERGERRAAHRDHAVVGQIDGMDHVGI